jgi:hypothetical protein
LPPIIDRQVKASFNPWDFIAPGSRNLRPKEVSLSELVVIAVSIIAAGMGGFGLTAPTAMARFVSRWQSKSGLWAASAIRLAVGIALWGAAAGSQFPAVFKVLSVVSVVVAIVLPLIGVSRFKSLLARWSRQSPGFVRVWSAAAVLMGAFLFWSVAA